MKTAYPHMPSYTKHFGGSRLADLSGDFQSVINGLGVWTDSVWFRTPDPWVSWRYKSYEVL